jgi:hypothetical protein
VLEHLQPSRYSEYLQVKWTQSITLDHMGTVWLVDRQKHVVVYMSATTRYIGWPALYQDYAGTRDQPGAADGSRLQAKFDSPTGIAVSSGTNQATIIYVADTNNHIIRKIANNRVWTVVGLKNSPGLIDGPTKDARLRFPESLGLDASGDHLMVLDNERRVRHLRLSLAVPTITTLVDGACRSVSRETFLTSIIVRTVECHTDWWAKDTGDTTLGTYGVAVICLGHQATCGARHHPALSDSWSPQLVMKPTTTTTSTTNKAS